MSWTNPRTAVGIPERVRTVADVSGVTAVTSAMRTMSMEITRDMIRKLQPMGFGEKHDAAVRGLMAIGYNIPIRVMCVGLYPYEQDILPHVATSLSYSPLKSHGCTPSVQILSQAMTAFTGSYRNRRIKKHDNEHMTTGLNDARLMAQFAMLLRCSYLCSVVGVAFINCVPVSVDNMAKRVRCASIFSEWLGRMIELHDSFGFKITILAMGSFAADSVRITFSSYKGTNTKVNYMALHNPAAIAYMNINKYPGMQPIVPTITDVEVRINTELGASMDTGSYVEYEWKVYPTATLSQFMKEQPIGALTRVLMNYTAEDLLGPFINMSKSLFSNMGSVPAGYTPGPIPDTDDTTSIQGHARDGGQSQRPTVNMSGPIFAQKSQDWGQNTNQSQDMNQGGSFGQNQYRDGGGGGGGGGSGGFYVGRNSIIAQMTDITGKSKSQQVIVLENMINKLEAILESFRSREKTVMKIVEMLDTIVDRHSPDDEELDEIIAIVKDKIPDEIIRLQEAVAVVAAMPALIEGDTGVIEGMIQPSAPLMRRHDGSTMRDAVYQQMMMDRSTGMAQSRNPPQSLSTYGAEVSTPGMGVFSDPSQVSRQSNRPIPNQLEVQRAMEQRQASADLFITVVSDHATDEMIDAIEWELFTDSAIIASTSTGGTANVTMLDIMTEAIFTYTNVKSGVMPSDQSLKGVIDLLVPTTHDTLVDVAKMIKDLYSSGDPMDIVSFFDIDMV